MALGLLAMAFFITVGALGPAKNQAQDLSVGPQLPWTPLTSERFVVLGDSHGGHLVSGLRSVTSGTVTAYTSGGCIPFRNVDRYDSRFARGECARKVNAYLDKLIAEDPSAIVILSSMGPVYLEGTAFNGKDQARVTGLGVELTTDLTIRDRATVFEVGIRSTLAELSQLKNVAIVFAIDIPELGIDHGCEKQSKTIELGAFKLFDLVNDPQEEACFVSRRSYDDRSRAYKALVQRVLLDFPKVRVFDPTDAFCDEEKCKGFDPEHGLLYRDVDHLSEAGSRYYALKLLEFLRAR